MGSQLSQPLREPSRAGPPPGRGMKRAMPEADPPWFGDSQSAGGRPARNLGSGDRHQGRQTLQRPNRIAFRGPAQQFEDHDRWFANGEVDFAVVHENGAGEKLTPLGVRARVRAMEPAHIREDRVHVQAVLGVKKHAHARLIEDRHQAADGRRKMHAAVDLAGSCGPLEGGAAHAPLQAITTLAVRHVMREFVLRAEIGPLVRPADVHPVSGGGTASHHAPRRTETLSHFVGAKQCGCGPLAAGVEYRVGKKLLPAVRVKLRIAVFVEPVRRKTPDVGRSELDGDERQVILPRFAQYRIVPLQAATWEHSYIPQAAPGHRRSRRGKCSNVALFSCRRTR